MTDYLKQKTDMLAVIAGSKNRSEKHSGYPSRSATTKIHSKISITYQVV